jgi:hypothetical protein
MMLMPPVVLAEDPFPPIPPIEIENDWIGWVASEPLRSDRPAIPGGASVLSVESGSTKSLPGEGYAWVQAYLGWAPLRMDAIAKTGLNGAVESFYCASRVVQVYKNGTPQGGTDRVGYWTMSGPVEAKKSVYGSIFGATWKNDTSHLVTDFELYEWGPQNSVSVYISW